MVGALLLHSVPQTTTRRPDFFRLCQLQESQFTDLTEHAVVKAIRHIYREFNQTADILSCQAFDERDSNGFFRHFGSVQSVHPVYSFLSQLLKFCQTSA